MAFEFYEGFKSYGGHTEIGDRWGSYSGLVSGLGDGPFKNTKALIPGTANLTTRDLGTEGTRTVGWRARVLGNNSSIFKLFWLDSGSLDQFELRIFLTATDGGGKWQIFRGATMIAEGSDDEIDPSAWHYFEARCKVDTSAGEFELRMDEKVLYSATGLNTANQGTAGSNFVKFEPFWLDRLTDIYITNGEFYGDVVIDEQFPIEETTVGDDDGDLTEWEEVSAGSHSRALEFPGAGLIRTEGPNDVAELHIQFSTCRGQVLSTLLTAMLFLESAGSETVRFRYKNKAGTVHNGTSQTVDSTNDLVFHEQFDTDPISSEPWDFENMRESQFGIEAVT